MLSGVQEFRSSEVQEFRSSGVQKFRSSEVQEFRSSESRSMAASLKIEEFRSNPINYSVTPATSVTSVFFFLCHAARTGVKHTRRKQQSH
jgi:hypothetical protein